LARVASSVLHSCSGVREFLDEGRTLQISETVNAIVRSFVRLVREYGVGEKGGFGVDLLNLYWVKVDDVTRHVPVPGIPRLHHQLLFTWSGNLGRNPALRVNTKIDGNLMGQALTPNRLRLCAFRLPLHPFPSRGVSSLPVHLMTLQIPQAVQTSFEYYPEGRLSLRKLALSRCFG
jgi:hypothetical protein